MRVNGITSVVTLVRAASALAVCGNRPPASALPARLRPAAKGGARCDECRDLIRPELHRAEACSRAKPPPARGQGQFRRAQGLRFRRAASLRAEPNAALSMPCGRRPRLRQWREIPGHIRERGRLRFGEPGDAASRSLREHAEHSERRQPR